MKIELEGTTFCVTGNFDNHQNTRTVEAALRAAGAKTVKSMGLKVEVLVLGTRSLPRQTQIAKDRGIPILRETELDTLLAKGSVEIDFEPPSVEDGDASIDELLGEVRGVLAEAPSPALWGQIVALVNQCDPDQLNPLVDYINGHIEHWPAHQTMLCVAPRAWAAAMLRGQDTPAYRLVRRLDLSDVAVNTTTFKKVLGCASLNAVESMDLATEKKLTKTAFKTLMAHPLMGSLDELVVGIFDEGCAQTLDVPSSLTSLGCYPTPQWRVPAATYETLFGAAACAGVKRLSFYSRHGWGNSVALVFAKLASNAMLPALEQLEIDFVRHGSSRNMNPMTTNTLAWTLDSTPEDARARIQTLTLRTRLNRSYTPADPFDMRPLGNLRTLRLFDAGAHRSDAVKLRDFDRVFHAHELRLPDSLERIVTNAPLDRGAFARLIQARPDLEVVQDPDEAPFAG